MTKLIRLTEITKSGNGTKTQPMLLQSDFIATVTTGKLSPDGPHLIGETKVRAVTFITFKNGAGTFAEESLDEIEKLTAFDYLSASQSKS